MLLNIYNLAIILLPVSLFIARAHAQPEVEDGNGTWPKHFSDRFVVLISSLLMDGEYP